MDDKNLWAIIDATTSMAIKEDIDEFDALKSLLLEQTMEDIVLFDIKLRQLKKLLQTPDAAAVALLLRQGISDDSFKDFQWWLIAQGEAVFNAFIRDPDSLADQLKSKADPMLWQVESLGLAGIEAYAEITGRDLHTDHPLAPELLEGRPDAGNTEALRELFPRFPRLVEAMKNRSSKRVPGRSS